jgi:hypothetical protein
MLQTTIAHALDEASLLIEQKCYFKAHEVLEGAWIEAKKVSHPQTLLLKGLINAAISFEHIKRNRSHSLKSSRITIQSYERYKSHLMKGIDNYDRFKRVQIQIEDHSYYALIHSQKL